MKGPKECITTATAQQVHAHSYGYLQGVCYVQGGRQREQPSAAICTNKQEGGNGPQGPAGTLCKEWEQGGGGWGPVPLPINPGTASKTATMVIYGEQFGLTVMDEMQKGAILLLPSQA